MSNSRFYNIWVKMVSRCVDTKDLTFRHYGAKGIGICDRWLTFQNFKDDMHDAYQKHVSDYGARQTSIDRISGRGNYEPANCRWATCKVQNNNRRDNVFVEHQGTRKTISEWGAQVGLSSTVISRRLKRGWSFPRAITSAVGQKYLNNERQAVPLHGILPEVVFP